MSKVLHNLLSAVEKESFLSSLRLKLLLNPFLYPSSSMMKPETGLNGFSQKGFITQRTIIPYEFRKLDLEPILNLFEFQKWTHLLTIPNTYYPDMLHQFLLILGKADHILISFLVSTLLTLN